MAGIGDWQIEDSGTLGVGAEYTPVEYPRSDENRGQVSLSNKGAASRTDDIGTAGAIDQTGDVNVPRRDATVNYEAGPYPEARIAADDEADMEGSGTA